MDNSTGTPIYKGNDTLYELGHDFARRIEPGPPRSGRAMSRSIMGYISKLSKTQSPSPAPGSREEWIRDNLYLVSREGQEAATSFRRSGKLFTMGDELLVFAAVRELLRAGDGHISEERLRLFMDGFQKAVPLPRRELCMLIPSIKAAAIEELCDENISGEKAGRLFGTLRHLATRDMSKCLDSLDQTDKILRQDPAEIYAKMDKDTRQSYLRRAELMAKKERLPEQVFARRIIRDAKKAEGRAQHVGFYLFPREKKGGSAYLAAVLLPTLALSLAAGFCIGPMAAALLLLPISAAAKAGADLIFLRLTPVSHVPRLELKDGIPKEAKTVCAISALITDEKCGPELARRMEDCYLLNRGAGDNVLFAILADFPESTQQELLGARKWITATEEAVNELISRYGNRFLLLTRPRILREGKYMGWERKRGAILELARCLRGQKSGIHCRAGDLHSMMGANYILTLDSDTRLAADSITKLVGSMLHPLNRPVLDEKSKTVKHGYGIISPRISTALSSATATPFARLFAGHGGVDPYSGACGEVYMDLTGSSVFSGKGIIDIDAFLSCAGSLPEGCILSHDAIEGALLRCGFAGDIELCDSFPGGVLAFYRRAHRWIRGDWQNAPWIRAKMGLSESSRLRIFDSLRRSLVSPAILLCMLLSLFGAPAAIGIIALLCSQTSLIFAALHAIVFRPEKPQRHHATVVFGLPGAIAQSICSLLLLPHEAWTNLSAIATALHRMCVSRKNLLEWSTAAQTQGGKGLVQHLRAMLPAAIIGLLCLWRSPFVLGKAAGICWAISPLFALLLSRPYPSRRQKLGCGDRCWLLTRVREMVSYFEEHICAENHWLPPDNFQERPPIGVAKRTSPTNIGLGLLSLLSAADLGITEADKAARTIDRCLGTIESLEKWRGHLYNWYSTADLSVLPPRYVSSVDSGNLCACLMALEAGLREYGYGDLACRAAKLAAAMDFSPLLDKEKMLLKIGINTDAPHRDEGCYDLLAGEVRLTAYTAIARGDIPKKVWEKMSRAMVALGSRRGMASWTGTMFEYLMPELLLPHTHGSLLSESHRFCLYAQRRRCKSSPWGISESAYNALDPSLSYRYKAHGCQSLALRPGMDEELVIAPYASFLALGLDAGAAIANLRRLEKEGAVGRYGFWEAIDHTPMRMRGTEGEIVHCAMAHHLGMSIVSAANLIQNGIWQRRFMSHSQNRAYLCLLEEKIPISPPLLHRSMSKAESHRPDRTMGNWSCASDVKVSEKVRCNMLSNGTYNVMSTSFGASASRCGDILIYAPADSLHPHHKGIDFVLTAGNVSRSLLPNEGGEYGFAFTQRESRYHAALGRLKSTVTATLCADCSGECRSIAIDTEGEGLYSAVLTVALRPVLAFENDYVNHPAFFGLGLEAKGIPGGILIRRLSRGSLDECWLCVKCDRDFSHDLSENSMSPRYSRGRQTEGWLNRSTLRLDIPLELTGGWRTELKLSLGFGANAEAAEACADKAMKLEDSDTAALPELSAALLGMDAAMVQEAMDMLPKLIYPKVENPCDTKGRGHLWSLGISGDFPLVVCRADSEEEIEKAEKAIRLCAYLLSIGAELELAIALNEGSAYHKPMRQKLTELMAKLGLEHLIGARGGIHFLDSSGDISSVINSSCLVLPVDRDDDKIIYNNYFMSTDYELNSATDMPVFHFGEQDSFKFYVNYSLPPVTWTNMLTNGRFSYIAADCGNGNMWFDNARECPISPWLNIPAAHSGYEEIIISLGGKSRSIFAGAETETAVSFYPGAAVWEGQINGTAFRAAAFVPMDADARVVIIECASAAEIRWKLPVALSPNIADRSFSKCYYVNQVFSARNPRTDNDAHFHALFSAEALDFSLGYFPGFEAHLPLNGRLVLVCGCDDEDKLRLLAAPDRAADALRNTLAYWKERMGRIKINTGNAALDRAVNTWLPYQSQACRIMGRSSVYQSGGAIGFRDQLQDAVNLLLTEPNQCREQILLSCRHQYLEGDVMHWWHPHPEGDRGVRTHCSDDLVWLPWALCEYAEKTGDTAILEEQTPWLISQPLGENDRDRYETPALTDHSSSVKDHCTAALEQVLSRGTGEHGLLRMLGGDWNDGMDKVYGESIWLTWFFAHTAQRFAALADDDSLLPICDKLIAAADEAWDTDHWLRGYFRDGTPLGAYGGHGCAIDSIAQSFAALCPVPPEKLGAALESALKQLRMGKLTALFTPPFGSEGPDPGYIRSYGPGFRENGGQYTHAAVWLAMACLRCGKRQEGMDILLDLLPENHDSAIYGAEPFVIPADVSTNENHFGRAGWTWYTGSAGWYRRIVLEDWLGIVPRDGRLHIEPKETDFSFVWKSSDNREYHVSVKDGGITVDGAPYDGKGLPL